MNTKRTIALASLAVVGLLGGCAKKTDPMRAGFEEGLRAYLERRGDFCIGKATWPVDVWPRDVTAGTRDALQMPVFERLGIVSSRKVTIDTPTDDGTIPAEVTRYELTPAGLQDYRSHEIGVNGAGEKVVAGDFCVARLSLSKITSWELAAPAAPGDRTRAVVAYTYEVATDPWTRDPEVQRVLPAVARVISGAGTAELKEPFTLTPQGWVADDLLPGDVRYVSNRPAAPGNP
jgi:hypothetical protein